MIAFLYAGLTHPVLIVAHVPRLTAPLPQAAGRLLAEMLWQGASLPGGQVGDQMLVLGGADDNAIATCPEP